MLIHGVEVCRHSIKPMKKYYKLYSNRGDVVPPIKVGGEATIVHNGWVIATGVIRVDD